MKKIEKLIEYLKTNRSLNVVIPCEGKKPLFSHKKLTWGWDSLNKFNEWEGCSVGILLKDIIVLDFDSCENLEEWLQKFPILSKCPAEKTKKGMHFYLGRTTECDTEEIYDKSRAMYINEKQTPIDVKTMCSTGTRGLIICAPSQNKQWIRPLWKTELPDIPSSLVQFIKLISHKVSPSNSITPATLPITNELETTVKNLLKEKLNDTTSTYYTTYCSNLYFRTNGTRKCPNGHVHKSNNFFLNLSKDGRVFYKCLSCECIGLRQTLLGYYINPLIQRTIEMPCVDDNYVELFLERYSQKYVYDSKFYMFNGVRWQEVQDSIVYMDIKETAKNTLQSQMKMIMGEKVDIDINRALTTETKTEATKTMDTAYKQLMKALSYISKHRNMENIKQATKNFMYKPNFADSLDTNPYLLGTNNGIIDLQTMTLMKGDPSQNISKSIGYDFFTSCSDYSPEINKEFENFVEQIYPNEDERVFAQRWFGYCLLGQAPEKFLVFLTDRRQGYNGKSKLVQLIRKTMGSDYAMVAKKEVLYKSERTDSKNSHDSSMLNFKGMRVAFVEELDPTKVMDDSWVKDNVGGSSVVQARGLFEKRAQNFEFITKLVICVNKGNMPKFDMTDPVIQSRFLTIPHRSKFATKQELETKFKEQEHTFEANPIIHEKFESWRPYCLLWQLKGLSNYFQNRIGIIPKGCQEFLDHIVNENDVIKMSVLKNIHFTANPDDSIRLDDLWNSYQVEFRDLQRDRRTKITKSKFIEKTKEMVDPKYYKERLQIKGERKYNVFVCHVMVP
tara:strand:+ start:547 stop:2904 length:2358 start_codon:yes stop_codon:yes gene_type:complete